VIIVRTSQAAATLLLPISNGQISFTEHRFQQSINMEVTVSYKATF